MLGPQALGNLRYRIRDHGSTHVVWHRFILYERPSVMDDSRVSFRGNREYKLLLRTFYCLLKSGRGRWHATAVPCCAPRLAVSRTQVLALVQTGHDHFFEP